MSFVGLGREMTVVHEGVGYRLVRSQLGDAASDAIGHIDLDTLVGGAGDNDVDRSTLAAALGVILFAGLLDRVPSAAAYVGERRASGERIRFDHGALRTIRFPDSPTGLLPPGTAAFARILEPLGYRLGGIYPLPRLQMTGRAYVHADWPELMPQYFVSELHVERFDETFRVAAKAVFASSKDPLSAATKLSLDRLSRNETLPFDAAAAALGDLVAAFDRQHAAPRLADYETLLAQSPEAAWIATEGNAFNHATDRVSDIEATAEGERLASRPIKETVETSSSGRVRQTAHRAATVCRPLVDATGGLVDRQVPGSFYEFIARDVDPATGTLDLGFDSGNATGIFAMTRAA